LSADQAVPGIILAITAIVLTTMFSGIMVSGMSGLQELNGKLLQNSLQPEVKIVFSGKTSATTVGVWIKNVGRDHIPPSILERSTLLFGPLKNFKIISYGSEPPCWSYSIIDGNGDGKWSPQETLEIIISWGEEFSPGKYYVKFHLYGGSEDDCLLEVS